MDAGLDALRHLPLVEAGENISGRQGGKVSERQLRVAPNTPGTFGLVKYGKISQIKR